MATALTLAQIVSKYREWHVPHQVYAGAATRGRPGTFAPIGITEHHTGGGSASASYLHFLFVTGRPEDGIPGPLCHEATDMGGKVWIGAAGGRANHAGMGAANTRAAVGAENYPGYTSEIRPGPDALNGNPLYYGNEWIYSGTRPPTAAQFRGAALAAAARCDAHGWTALSAFAHREHTRRKRDPYGILMYEFRKEVQRILDAGPAATVNYVATGKLEVPKPPSTDIPPATQEGNDMGTWTEAQLRAMMQAENEEYAIRFWIDPTGTGTAMRNLQTNMKLQLDRIENALAQHSSNDLVVRELDAGGLTAESRELVTALENSVAELEARPAAAELRAFLNADGTMDEVHVITDAQAQGSEQPPSHG